MIFIYNCYAGTHSSSLASAIHLKKLTAERIPTRKEILNTDYFDKLKSTDMGRIIFRGTDDEGNKVYTMGRGPSRLVVPCMANMINLLGNEFGFSEKIIFSNMSPCVPLAMSIGGFLSRRFGLRFIGVPLLIIGAKQTHKRIVEVVNKTRQASDNIKGNVLVLTNENKNDEEPSSTPG